MTDKGDPLDYQPLALTTELTESGFGVKAISRALGAFDTLIGRLVDIPNARLEGIARRQRARDDVSIDLIRVAGARAVDVSSVDDEVSRILLERLLGTEARHLMRRRDVAARATKEMLRMPAPETHAEADKVRDEPDAVDEDWLDLFGRYVDRASSERLRILWGRILAGEIRTPSSFSLTTLRAISELDKEIAETFQSWIALRLQGRLIPRAQMLQGPELLDGLFLEEVGLLGQIDPPLSYFVDFEGQEKAMISGRTLALIVESNGTTKVTFPVTQITRVGREIAMILPAPDEQATFLAIANLLRPNVKSLQLGTIVGTDGKNLRIASLQAV